MAYNNKKILTVIINLIMKLNPRKFQFNLKMEDKIKQIKKIQFKIIRQNLQQKLILKHNFFIKSTLMMMKKHLTFYSVNYLLNKNNIYKNYQIYFCQ